MSADLVEKIQALCPMIAEKAPEAEAARRPLDEIIEALKTLDQPDRRPEDQGAVNSLDIHRSRRRKSQSRRFGGLGLCSYRKGDRRRQPFEI